LKQPLYRDNGQFVQIAWDDAFAMWAKAIRDAQASGKGVGAIGGGRLLNEEAYLLQHVFRGMGVKNIDWRAGRQIQATPARPGTSYEAIETAAAVIVVGESPEERAPVLWLRAIKAVKRGAKLIRIGSHDRAPSVAHVDVATISEAMAHIPAEGSIAVIWDGINPATDLREALAQRDGFAFIANEQPNARGAEAMGVLPSDGGLTAWQMLDGSANLGVLSLFGVNPVRNTDSPEAVAATLRATPFVVVSELFLTETAELATLVLPALGAFEKAGTTTNAAGSLLPVNAALEAPEGPLSDLEMFVGLAQHFSIALPSVEELEAAVVARVASHQLAHPAPSQNRVARPAHSMWDGGGTSKHDPNTAALRNAPAGVA
jgi:NADH-quinone oxidoreductase subunit G